MPVLDLLVEEVECIEDALGFVAALTVLDEESKKLLEQTQNIIANQMKDYDE